MRYAEICEEFLDAFKLAYGSQTLYVELFVNPNSKELRQLNSSEGVRGFLTANNLIVWGEQSALHQNVREQLNLPNDAISIILYEDSQDPNVEVLVTDNTKGTKWHENPDTEEYIKQHPAWWVDEDYVQVYYYNEPEVGRWEELDD